MLDFFCGEKKRACFQMNDECKYWIVKMGPRVPHPQEWPNNLLRQVKRKVWDLGWYTVVTEFSLLLQDTAASQSPACCLVELCGRRASLKASCVTGGWLETQMSRLNIFKLPNQLPSNPCLRCSLAVPATVYKKVLFQLFNKHTVHATIIHCRIMRAVFSKSYEK